MPIFSLDMYNLDGKSAGMRAFNRKSHYSNNKPRENTFPVLILAREHRVSEFKVAGFTMIIWSLFFTHAELLVLANHFLQPWGRNGSWAVF